MEEAELGCYLARIRGVVEQHELFVLFAWGKRTVEHVTELEKGKFCVGQR